MINNIPKKIQVAIKSNDEKLGFARRYISESDKDSLKFKESIMSWANSHNEKDCEYKILDNIPTKGFSFGKSVRRWSTSNKLIRVDDPRGFTLEISMENLASIISQCTICQGDIENEMFWAFDKGNIRLLLNNGIEHKEFLKENERTNELVHIKAKELEFGKVYQKKNGEEVIYAGKAYYRREFREGGWYNNSQPYIKVDDETKYHIFVEIRNESIYTNVYKSIPKVYKAKDKFYEYKDLLKNAVQFQRYKYNDTYYEEKYEKEILLGNTYYTNFIYSKSNYRNSVRNKNLEFI